MALGAVTLFAPVAWGDALMALGCSANAEGGVLHNGRNDKGVAVSVPNVAKLLQDIPNKVRDILGIMVTAFASAETPHRSRISARRFRTR